MSSQYWEKQLGWTDKEGRMFCAWRSEEVPLFGDCVWTILEFSANFVEQGGCKPDGIKAADRMLLTEQN